MTKLSPLAIVGISVGSLVVGYFLWSKTKNKSKKVFHFPDSDDSANALKIAKKNISSIIPVSRDFLINAIQNSSKIRPAGTSPAKSISNNSAKNGSNASSKGGSNKGKRKTHKKRK